MPLVPFPNEHLILLFDRNAYSQEDAWLPSDTQLTQWVTATLPHALASDQQGNIVEVSLNCVSSAEIRELNAQYRSKNSATNVLSFPADMPVLPAEDSTTTPTMVLGDVVVCPEVLVTEAREQHKLLEHHWAHMLIHSVLHLNGFDHEDEITGDAMESLEIQILSTLGITNPYLAVSAN